MGENTRRIGGQTTHRSRLFFTLKRNIIILGWENDPICTIEISESGNIYKIGLKKDNISMFPLQHFRDKSGLEKWWNNRAVPIKQGKIRELIEEKGFLSTQEFLVKNLGLSLTDYYWIKPIDSDLVWEKVNLYTNNFREGMVYENSVIPDDNVCCYSPDASLQGQLPKCWTIKKETTDYDYGCVCEAFTILNKEFVSAYDI